MTVEVEIVAYAAFAENGNIQLWGKSRAPFENLYNLVGNPQPLMTVAQHQEIVDRLLAQQEAAAVVPDGFAMIPDRIELAPADIATILFHCGGDEDATEVDEQFHGGTLWVGNVQHDDGTLTHGLHISSVECPEEGSTTIAEFAGPSPAVLKEAK